MNFRHIPQILNSITDPVRRIDLPNIQWAWVDIWHRPFYFLHKFCIFALQVSWSKIAHYYKDNLRFGGRLAVTHKPMPMLIWLVQFDQVGTPNNSTRFQSSKY